MPAALGHQAGLADASAAADQRQAGAARRGGSPQVAEQAEFRCPADKLCGGYPGTADGRLGGRRPRACRASVGHQALERLLRRRVRGDAELTLENRSAVMVGAHRACPVTQPGLQLHQGAVAGLLHRLELDPATCGIGRSGQVAHARPRFTQQVAQLDALALKP